MSDRITTAGFSCIRDKHSHSSSPHQNLSFNIRKYSIQGKHEAATAEISHLCMLLPMKTKSNKTWVINTHLVFTNVRSWSLCLYTVFFSGQVYHATTIEKSPQIALFILVHRCKSKIY